MRKISLTLIGCYIGILSAFSQGTKDSTAYKSRKLRLDEINFVSGYYKQSGNNSAVTGGIGTEELTDIANTIELRMLRYDRGGRKHSFSFELGVDHYTSASSDRIDPATISSPSYSDTRYYPTLGWSVQDEAKGFTAGLTAAYSYEYDYKSMGVGLNLGKTSKDGNRELSLRLQAFFDTWAVILPIELRMPMGNPGDHDHGIERYAPRNSYSAALTLSQVINRNLQLAFIAEPAFQDGLLATRYQRVYFTDGSVQAENLPGRRFKLPLALRASLFAGDAVVLRPYYRFYTDDWGLQAHTAELETALKLSPFTSLTPFYRFYTQSEADYFAPYQKHAGASPFFTSDYDLSRFTSHFFGAGIRLTPEKGLLGLRRLNALELRYGHYRRSNGLRSDQLSLHLKIR
jgi:hypothetical protein